MLGERWRALDAAEREKYSKQAHRERMELLQQLDEEEEQRAEALARQQASLQEQAPGPEHRAKTVRGQKASRKQEEEHFVRLKITWGPEGLLPKFWPQLFRSHLRRFRESGTPGNGPGTMSEQLLMTAHLISCLLRESGHKVPKPKSQLNNFHGFALCRSNFSVEHLHLLQTAPTYDLGLRLLSYSLIAEVLPPNAERPHCKLHLKGLSRLRPWAPGPNGPKPKPKPMRSLGLGP